SPKPEARRSHQRPAQPADRARDRADAVARGAIRGGGRSDHVIEIPGVDADTVTRAIEDRRAAFEAIDVNPARQLGLGLVTRRPQPGVAKPDQRELPGIRDSLIDGLVP